MEFPDLLAVLGGPRTGSDPPVTYPRQLCNLSVLRFHGASYDLGLRFNDDLSRLGECLGQRCRTAHLDLRLRNDVGLSHDRIYLRRWRLDIHCASTSHDSGGCRQSNRATTTHGPAYHSLHSCLFLVPVAALLLLRHTLLPEEVRREVTTHWMPTGSSYFFSQSSRGPE